MQRAKKAMTDKEAQLRGQKWLSEVQDEKGHWNSFEEWSARYEPKKEPTERQKAAKDKTRKKAVDMAIAKVEVSMSTRLVNIMLEVTSKLLGMVEMEVTQKQQRDHDVLIKILNVANAIVLSYRFDSQKGGERTRKCVYLRKAASDELTDVLRDTMTKNVDALADLKATLLESFEAKQEQLRSLVSTIVKSMLHEAKMQADDAIETATQGLSLDASIEELKDSKHDMIAGFIELLQNQIIARMVGVREALANSVGVVFGTVDRIMSKLDMKLRASEEALREEMHAVVEDIYKRANDGVTNEVKGVLSMLKGLMDSTDEEEVDA